MSRRAAPKPKTEEVIRSHPTSARDFIYSPKSAQQLNGGLPINPAVSTFGTSHAVLSGRSKSYFVPDFRGPLSLKATLEGIATWKVDNRQCRVSESTYLVVNAGQPYTISYDERSYVTTFCLLFKDGYLEQMSSARRNTEAGMLDEPFSARNVEFPTTLHAGPSSVLARLRAFANELATRYLTSELWELRFHEIAIALLEELDTSTCQPTTINAAKASTRRELLRRVSIGRDYLISMNDRPISVEEAARAACVSTFHFHRTFVQAFGLSPHAFLRNFRMQRASDLLRFTDLPVCEIARMVGFRSIGSFGNVFRRTYGSAPQAHRAAQSGGQIGQR